MGMNTVDAKLLQKLFLAGAKSIEANKEYINELNVFPVPDGDTGTNMSLTIMAAAKDVNQLDNPSMQTLAKAISSGSLRGARGNSGVILSQLFRGFCKVVRDYEELNVTILANAFERAVETAYKAVMKPKEGTILTVAKGGAERAAQLVAETDDCVVFLEEVIKYMDEVLSRTPDMLPVLKEAGVVDSGGQGLLTIMQGAYDALMGKEVDIAIEAPKAAPVVEKTGAANDNISTADIKFGYCTEFIIMLEKAYDMNTEADFKAYLESIGDSIVVVSDDDIVKVHVHTNDPGLAIQRALSYGSLTRMKIDNMREEHNERVVQENEKQQAANVNAASVAAPTPVKAPEKRKSVGFIAVSIGAGLDEIFKGLGADYLIAGGQTMNPSTEDMLNAIDAVNADTIFIFPNNSNIILAAEQAKHLTEDKEIIVIPSKTVPQGITALINYVFDKSPAENEKNMIEEMKRVKTGQVTYAVRDTNLDGKDIKKDDIMGIGDKVIMAVGREVADTTVELVSCLMDDESELISLYYGEEVTEEEAQAVADMISEQYPDVDVEVHPGGQPIYYYVLSVE